MFGVFLDDVGLRQRDRSLGVGSRTHAEQTARVMVAFEPVVDELRPDLVVVVGDVNSTVGCELAAAKVGAMMAHVEASLRCRDWSIPKVVNRVVTDRVSGDPFAPSADAVANPEAGGTVPIRSTCWSTSSWTRCSPSASAFLGDGRIPGLGTLIAYTVVVAWPSGIHVHTLISIAAIFPADTSIVTIKHVTSEQAMATAHREHGYQRLTRNGANNTYLVVAAFARSIIAVGFGLAAIGARPAVRILFDIEPG